MNLEELAHRLQRLERRIAMLEGRKPGVETDTEMNKEES